MKSKKYAHWGGRMIGCRRENIAIANGGFTFNGHDCMQQVNGSDGMRRELLLWY
jgi:hypothetical protein